MQVYIANDHAGFDCKEEVLQLLKDFSFEVIDLGTNSTQSVSYSTYAIELAKKIQSSEESRGILICGSGIGVSMAANRFKGIRAARCLSVEDAQMSRKHNDANVLCLASRSRDMTQNAEIIKEWFKTEFEHGRHTERINAFNHLGES